MGLGFRLVLGLDGRGGVVMLMVGVQGSGEWRVAIRVSSEKGARGV